MSVSNFMTLRDARSLNRENMVCYLFLSKHYVDKSYKRPFNVFDTIIKFS